MMVGIAYGMPFELDQFGLFHVSMHIDATTYSNNGGHPLVTLTSKDSNGKIVLFSKRFCQASKVGHSSGCFKQSFLCLLENMC
jgi:hypothetical protein